MYFGNFLVHNFILHKEHSYQISPRSEALAFWRGRPNNNNNKNNNNNNNNKSSDMRSVPDLKINTRQLYPNEPGTSNSGFVGNRDTTVVCSLTYDSCIPTLVGIQLSYFTYDSCIATNPAPLIIPHAAYKYSKASYHIFILKWRPLNRAV